MNKLKRICIISMVLVVILISLLNVKIFAIDNENVLQQEEYSEEFKRWLELPEEERKKVMMPRPYEIKNTNVQYRSPLYMAKMVKASMNGRYSLKDQIPANLVIKDQKSTNSCWAFATVSALETNLAIANLKKGTNLSKVYDFSERHIEYFTSKTFSNGEINVHGYNREVGDGGSQYIAQSYLTNGSGAILEVEMPFENNEDKIDISKIQNKTVSSEVYDTVEFPSYRNENDENKVQIMNRIKQHIQNYGSVYATLHGSSANMNSKCYNNDTGAKYCNNEYIHSFDHAVSIIGWDDNYSTSNFTEGNQPKSNGAWIVRNSWGELSEEWKVSELKDTIFTKYEAQCKNNGWNSAEEIPDSYLKELGYTVENDTAYIKYGDNGIIYVSYEDVNISKNMFGIEKATDTVNYDYIYQYDEFYPVGGVSSLKSNTVMLCNIFNKKTSGTEYLTQVSLYAPETYTCKVYVNPNGTSKSKDNLQLVTLKAGESETFNAGYHTIEFAEPIEIKSASFAVVIEVQGTNENTVAISLENKNASNKLWDNVKVEEEKCFLLIGNNLDDSSKWRDLGKLSETNASLTSGDSTIKAFTTTQLFDEKLESIEIATPPNKTSYFEGENFDKTGMVVKANYNSKNTPYIILDNSSYDITDGNNLVAGQKSVTIAYEDKSVKQTINVEKNSVTGLKIKTAPTKTEYKEGENFDATGMVVEATYKDGTSKEVTDYTIENGNNLKANQTQVTITYGEIKIEQNITITENSLIEISVTKAPNKTKYVVGQNFDKTGMVVVGKYQDETTQEIIDYTIEDGINLAKGQTSVTIKYDGKITSQEITVEEKSITKITISKMPAKTQYIQNREELELAGGIIKVEYNDGTNEEIELTDEQVKVSGFDNSKTGKNMVTVTYQQKSISFEIEIIEEEKAKNSDFDKASCIVNSAKYYTFTDKNNKEYLLINVTINDIVKENGNDNYEYYYYLSSNVSDTNIENWVKIDGKQIENGKMAFEINTQDVKDYEELANVNNLYLYIREVAIKGGNQTVVVSKAMEVDSEGKMETYLDNEKVNNNNSNTNNDNKKDDKDNTTISGDLPKTGVRNILGVVLVIAIIGGIAYIRYKYLSKYVK